MLWKQLCYYSAIGISLGILSYFGAIRRLENFIISVETSFTTSDMYAAIFVHSDFNQFEYLNHKDMMMLFLPFFFYFIGIMIGSQPFLSRQKAYHQYIYSRINERNQLARFLQGHGYLNTIVYSGTYFFTIIVGVECFPPDFLIIKLEYSMWQLILFFVMRIIMLLALTLLTFIIFIRKGATFAVLFSILMITVALLIDMQLTAVNLALFEGIDKIKFGILIWAGISALAYYYSNRKMIYELN